MRKIRGKISRKPFILAILKISKPKALKILCAIKKQPNLHS